MSDTYKIVRFYYPGHKPSNGRAAPTIKAGLTLKEAQEHCSKEETRRPGVYFDGYTKE